MSNPRSVADHRQSLNDSCQLYFLATMSQDSLHLLYLCASLGIDSIPVHLLMTKFTMNNVNRLHEFQFMTLSDDKELLLMTPETRELIRGYLLKFNDERLRSVMQENTFALIDALMHHPLHLINKYSIDCYIALTQQLYELTGTIGDAERQQNLSDKLASLLNQSGQRKEKYAKKRTPKFIPAHEDGDTPPEAVVKQASQPQSLNESTWDSTAVASAVALTGLGLFAFSRMDDQSRQVVSQAVRSIFKF